MPADRLFYGVLQYFRRRVLSCSLKSDSYYGSVRLRLLTAIQSLFCVAQAQIVNRNPLLGAPIAQTSHTRHTVPLYLVWYLMPSNGHAKLVSPA